MGVAASILALGIACLDLFFHLIRYFENDKLPSCWCTDIFDLFMHWIYRFNETQAVIRWFSVQIQVNNLIYYI